jgi:hypothetical protein
MNYRCLVLLLADRISRREDAVIYRAGFSNEADSLALRVWNKSNNLAHIRSKLLLDLFDDDHHTTRWSYDLSTNFGSSASSNEGIKNA